ILVSQYTADRPQLKVGDDFIMYSVPERMRQRKFTIAAIYHTGVEELDKTYVLGALSLVRRLNGWARGEVGGYELSIRDFERLADLTMAVQDALPIEVEAVNVRDQLPEIFQWLDLLDVNTIIILILMMVVA